MYIKSTILSITLLGCAGSLSAQNVGIGTLTPTHTLHVEGSLRATSLGGSGNAIVITDNSGVVSPTALSGNATDVFTGAGTFAPISSFLDGWKLTGNAGTSPATNFLGTTDAQDFVLRTNNAERIRVLSNGLVGIGIGAPTQKLDVQGGNARINNAFIGDVGHGATWAGFSHASQNTTSGYGFLQSNDGAYTLINKENTGGGYIGFRQGNSDMAVIDFRGNMGVGTNAPAANARIQAVGGSIMPAVGNANTAGIYFPANPGGGGGDEAYIRYFVESGENTQLVIANQNDAGDDIDLQTGGQSRLLIEGDGSIRIDEGVLFDCDDCGDVATIDGASNWGDMVIQGRVLSTNSNLHLSPPQNFHVIINDNYRAAGGTSGGTNTHLIVEDGGIQMRKRYYYFQRYHYNGSSNGVDASSSHNLGAWDFCAVAHVGFKNNASSTDEDDDVQCAVYPNTYGAGEQTNYTNRYTHAHNGRPTWTMYLEAFEDTNGVTCSANCINFDGLDH